MNSLPSHHYDGAVLIAPKAQEAYFARYRQDHPEECFDVLDLDALSACFQYELGDGYCECLLSYGVREEELPLARLVLPRLRYALRIDSLQKYFDWKDILEKEGYLRISCDPFAFFKGRSIIVRGYYDGKGIAEALQDLPNICVNYDYGLDPLRRADRTAAGTARAGAPHQGQIRQADQDQHQRAGGSDLGQTDGTGP